MNIYQEIINNILFRKARANSYFKKLAAYLECDASDTNGINESLADMFLTVLLNLMALFLYVHREYRLNIRDFEAKYVFIMTSKNKNRYVAAEFKNNKLKISQKQIQNPDFTLKFKDGKSFFKLIFSETPDVLNSMLNQEVDFDGNLNYLNKFAYMAIRLKLMAAGKVKW